MADLGKIDRSFFERVIASRLGADREDVALGPAHGVDFGVIDVGEALVVATDPLSILPELGFERAGRLALDIALADVAVSGIAPSHVTICLTLPPGMENDDLEAIWCGIDGHAREHGVSIVGGHTARYEGIETSWVGSATALGVGAFDSLVRPDGARPGDAIVCATGPAAEAVGLFSTLYPDRLDLPAETIAVAEERVEDIVALRDARIAFEAGAVWAMHDATEGGVLGALFEMAEGADVRFEIEREAMPVRPGVEAVCDALGLDPWRTSSAGSLLMSVAPADCEAIVDALEAEGTPAAVVGTVCEGSGVSVDGERAERAAGGDPLWTAFVEAENESDPGPSDSA